jgi:phage-related protein
MHLFWFKIYACCPNSKQPSTDNPALSHLSNPSEIGGDVQAVQFGWPLGLPLVRHLQGDLWEVLTSLKNRIARVIFAVEGNTMYLLHGFIKTTQKTPLPDLELALKRWKQIKP